jgi:hypothetical protein
MPQSLVCDYAKKFGRLALMHVRYIGVPALIATPLNIAARLFMKKQAAAQNKQRSGGSRF